MSRSGIVVRMVDDSEPKNELGAEDRPSVSRGTHDYNCGSADDMTSMIITQFLFGTGVSSTLDGSWPAQVVSIRKSAGACF